jgi:hypothetical protein
LGNDFSITLLPLQEGELNNNQCIEWYTSTISLENNKAYALGIPEISELLKIYVSTDAFDTYMLEQEALEFDSEREVYNLREISISSVTNKPDWKTINIDLSIIRPIETQALNSNSSFQFLTGVITIEPPKGISAEVSFSALNTNTRSLQQKPSFLNNQNLLPFELSEGNNRSGGLSVLELKKFRRKANHRRK